MRLLPEDEQSTVIKFITWWLRQQRTDSSEEELRLEDSEIDVLLLINQRGKQIVAEPKSISFGENSSWCGQLYIIHTYLYLYGNLIMSGEDD